MQSIKLLLLNTIALPFFLCSMPASADSPMPADSIESLRVNQVIESMHEALVNADTGAYMALVDPSDPVFATEQRAWISDLQTHPVNDPQISIAWNEPVRLLDDGRAVAPIEIEWHIEGEELNRHLAYDALFKPVGSSNGQWIFVGRHWDIELLDTPGVRIYADKVHEEIALLAQSRVPQLRDTIADNMGQDLDLSNLQEVVVKVYPEMSSLQASIFLSYSDPLAGWNEPGESIKILGREKLPQNRLDPLLAHEIGHAVSFEFGDEIINAPWWTLEGIAEVAAGLFRDSWDRKNKQIVKLAKDDNLRPWPLLADFRGEANNHARYVYLQGWSMVDYIDRTYTVEKRNAWFTQLASGDTLEEATPKALGITFDQLDKQWNQSLLDWQPEPDESTEQSE
jgi:Peptidase MA superfamily